MTAYPGWPFFTPDKASRSSSWSTARPTSRAPPTRLGNTGRSRATSTWSTWSSAVAQPPDAANGCEPERRDLPAVPWPRRAPRLLSHGESRRGGRVLLGLLHEPPELRQYARGSPRRAGRRRSSGSRRLTIDAPPQAPTRNPPCLYCRARSSRAATSARSRRSRPASRTARAAPAASTAAAAPACPARAARRSGCSNDRTTGARPRRRLLRSAPACQRINGFCSQIAQ